MLKYLLLSVLVFQTVHSTKILSNGFEAAKSIYDKINDFIGNGFNDFTKKMEEATNKLSDALKNAKENLCKHFEDLKDSVGNNVACVTDNQGRIDAVTKKIQDGMDECWAKAQTANKDTSSAFPKFKDEAEKRLKVIWDKVTHCGLNPLCYAEATKDLLEAKVQMEIKIPVMIVDSILEMKTTHGNYDQCIIANGAAHADEMASIGKDIGECIKKETVGSIDAARTIGDNIHKFLGDKVNEFTEKFQEAANKLSNALKTAKDNLFKRIEELKNSVGNNIACLTKNQERIDDVNKKIRDGMDECWSKAHTANKDTFKTFTNVKDNAENRLKDVWVELKNCRLTTPMCLAEVTKDLFAIKLGIESEILGLLINAVREMKTTHDMYNECLDANDDSHAEEMTSLVNDIRDCIKKANTKA